MGREKAATPNHKLVNDEDGILEWMFISSPNLYVKARA